MSWVSLFFLEPQFTYLEGSRVRFLRCFSLMKEEDKGEGT